MEIKFTYEDAVKPYCQEEKEVITIDDNRIYLDVTKCLLEKNFSQVKDFIDSEKALEYIKNNHSKIKFCFIDSIMPKLNGLEVIENIRAFEEENHLSRLGLYIITGDSSFSIIKPSDPHILDLVDSVIFKPLTQSKIDLINNGINTLYASDFNANANNSCFVDYTDNVATKWRNIDILPKRELEFEYDPNDVALSQFINNEKKEGGEMSPS